MSNTATATSPPLTENTHIKELLTILAESRMDGAAKEFLAILSYVGMMERQLEGAASELQNIRQELGAMREAQNHPVRTAMQNVADSMEARLSEARSRLDSLNGVNLYTKATAHSMGQNGGKPSVQNGIVAEHEQTKINPAVKNDISEEARKFSLELKEYGSDSPLKLDEVFFSQEAREQRKLDLSGFLQP